MYHYYIVDDNYPARVHAKTLKGEIQHRDGTWVPVSDVSRIVWGGDEVTEEEANAFWAGKTES